jgi:hypothetical protein
MSDQTPDCSSEGRPRKVKRVHFEFDANSLHTIEELEARRIKVLKIDLADGRVLHIPKIKKKP